MLKGVLIGLLILVVCVFAYVGYSGYSTGRSAGSRETATGGGSHAEIRAEPSGASTMPTLPTTGEAAGNGLVAQGGAVAGVNGMTVPTTDSIAANPPNGMTFGGSGHYQLYRQGDLTWRLNTDTGETCVIFATDEEWRKPKVYQAGCRGK